MLAAICAELSALPKEPGNNKGYALFSAARRLSGSPASVVEVKLCGITETWHGWSRAKALRTIRRGHSPSSRFQQPLSSGAPVIDPQVFAQIWQLSVPILQDAFCYAALIDMKLSSDPTHAIDQIVQQNLARALEPGVSLPSCASFGGKAWPSIGYALILLLWAPRGRVAGIRARYLGTPKPNRPKSISPKGAKLTGLVMMNDAARRWSKRQYAPREIDIVEGESDFLAHAIRHPNRAIIGVVSGSWTEKWTRLVPRCCVVNILTDLDPSGDAYARKIQRSLERAGVTCRRWVGYDD
jgi:hypothetical protein